MIFTLSEEARRVSEHIVGVSCDQIMKTPLKSFTEINKDTKKVQYRQIKSRGSLYLQLGRRAAVERYKKIIKKF